VRWWGRCSARRRTRCCTTRRCRCSWSNPPTPDRPTLPLMMGQGISEVLPFAIGIAISPIPIVAVILMLFSNRAKVNGPAFLAGWVRGIAVGGSVVYFVLDAANAATDSTTSDTVSWGKVALGVLLLGLARRNWAKRPHPGEAVEMPKWMATVETISPMK